MKVVLFYHSFVSCWNHGNAHFLRGVVRELVRRGHDVHVHEPHDGWSRANALRDGGASVLTEAARLVPGVTIHRYDSLAHLDHALDGADVVVVHEWNEPDLVSALGARRAHGAPFRLLFHDTHHRAVSRPADILLMDLDGYDGVLAFGESLRAIYDALGFGARAFTWHEAADTALFRPLERRRDHDFVFVGNWGDDERDRELRRFLLQPVARLRLRARLHGVRYPQRIRDEIAACGIEYGGWLPNHRTPEIFATARLTVHVPRRYYSGDLPGIPTIRVFEALACGLPLVCAPWDDAEQLFPDGCYLTAHDTDEMTAAIAAVLSDYDLATHLATTGLEAIRDRHTCAHRVDELFSIVDALTYTRGSSSEASSRHEAVTHA